MRKFSRVYIEISNICNLQCSFCPEVKREKLQMDLPLFRQVVAEVAPLTDQVCLHLMGDPLTHPRLAEFVDICEEKSLRIFLVTNGVLLRPDRQESLLRPAFRQVCFSLHSFPDNFPEQDPTAYLERIFSFTERALRERPDLYLNFRLWNLQNARGGTRNEEILERIESRFGTKVPRSVDVRRKKSYRLQGRLYLHFDTEFVWPALDLPVLKTEGTCRALSNHFGILADGTVVPCCLDKEAGIPLGKIGKESLSEIFRSARVGRIEKGFRTGHLVEDLCQRCQYSDRFSGSRDELLENDRATAFEKNAVLE